MRLAFLLRPAPNDATAAQVSEVSAEVIQRVRGAGPVVLGPHGGEGRESAIRSADDLPAASDEPQVLVARRPPPAARRSRLVVVGDDVFGAAEAGRAQPVLSDLARRCGPTLGLELYAVEAAETDAGPVVLPLDPIPDFAGVPAAGRRLAEYVARAGRR